jgi:protein-tyrosine phosphatase
MLARPIDPDDPPRDIALVDTYNLRDLGGYPTADGRRVRWRTLFRGASLQRLAGADAETVRELGLLTAIDLRTANELTNSGGYPVEVLPATVHHLPMLSTIWELPDPGPDEAAERFLLARYHDMLAEGAAAIVETMEILARPERLPAVFYCAAGKDRTGVLAALVLDAIGVEDEHIVADYHLSKERVERIRARAVARADSQDLLTAMVSQPPQFMAAPPEAMQLFLALIREEHGSTTGYLRGIGVSEATIAAVAANLLEPIPA